MLKISLNRLTRICSPVFLQKCEMLLLFIRFLLSQSLIRLCESSVVSKWQNKINHCAGYHNCIDNDIVPFPFTFSCDKENYGKHVNVDIMMIWMECPYQKCIDSGFFSLPFFFTKNILQLIHAISMTLTFDS